MFLNKNNSTNINDYIFFIQKGSFIVGFDQPYSSRHLYKKYPVKMICFNQDIFINFSALIEASNNKKLPLNFLFVFNDFENFDNNFPYNYHSVNKILLYKNIIQFSNMLSDNIEIKDYIVIFNNFKDWSEVLSKIYLYGRIHLEGEDSSTRHVFSALSLRFSEYLSLFSFNKIWNLYSLLIKDKNYLKPKKDYVKVEHNERNIQKHNNSVKFIHNLFNEKNSEAINLLELNTTKPYSIQDGTLNKKVLTSCVNKRFFHSKRFLFSKRCFHSTCNVQNRFDVYSKLENLIKNNPINEETQIKLEKILLNYELVSFESKKDLSGLNTGYFNKEFSKFLSKTKNLLQTKISQFLANRSEYTLTNKHKYLLVQLIDVVGIQYIISVILGRFFRIISHHSFNLSHQNIATNIMIEITTDIVREYSSILFEEKKSELSPDIIYTLSDWKKENQDFLDTINNVDNKVYIGSLVIEWMEDTDLLRKQYIQTTKKEIQNIFSPSTQVCEEIGFSTNEVLMSTDSVDLNIHLNQFFYVLPVRLPMICKPKLYTNKSLGGYLLNDKKFTHPIILDNPRFKIKTLINNDNNIIDLVNNINSVAYKINTNVLDFINTYPKYFGNELLDTNYIHPYSKLKNLKQPERKELKEYNSKLFLQQNIFKIVNIYKQLKEFYFLVRLDSRGRLYCVTEYLNYQGTELAKSLLLFAKPSYVSRTDYKAINYLKVFGVHCYGNKIDKLSFNEKVKWVDDNILNIKDFKNGYLIKQAENKFLFTAFCFEYNKWLDFENDTNQDYFKSYLPVQLDATCNGYQHLALLCLDTKLSKHLNLTESSLNEKPNDFYTFLLKELFNYINNQLNTSTLDESTRLSYERLNNFDFQRRLIKKGIMTIPYNATNPRLIEYILGNLVKWEDENQEEWYGLNAYSETKLNYKDISNLVKVIRVVLSTSFPQLTLLTNYLKDMAKLCTELQIVIPWTLPSGLKVSQSYLETKSVQLKPFTYCKTKFSVNVYLDKFDKPKQIRSFMPNLIHSLDATTLAFLVTNYFKSDLEVNNLFTIHDCFGVSINHIDYIIDLLKICYITLYSDDKYLMTLHTEIIRNIIYTFGEESYNVETNTVKTENITRKLPDINLVLHNKSNFDFNSLKKSTYLIV